MQSIYLAGGCFWCIEAIFLKLKGVRSIAPGYIGGVSKNPTYEEICTGTSGHAEAIKCDFDDKIIVFEDIDCMSDIVFTRDKSPSTPTEEGIKKEASQSQLISTVIKACKDDDYEPLKSLKTEEDKLTLSFVLNVIDGIRETPGRIIIISSNYYDKLDKALVRPGRIDMCLNMELASHKVIEQMFEHFYGYNKKAPVISDILNEINNVTMNDIPDGILSQAEVVQCYNDNPKKFVLNLVNFKK